MKFDTQQYKVYTWKNWMMLHWILNPGLAINELILGQRVPKISLEDKTIDKPRYERTFVPCPHCETLHDGRTWSTINGTAFKNWFGLYCKNCGNTIPCLTNGLSFIILGATFPIWGLFRKDLKAYWLKKQPQRYKHLDVKHTSNAFDKKSWIKTGLSWGGFMFLTMSVGFPYFNNEEITLKTLTIGLIVWTIGGLLFGYSMKRFMNYKGNKK
jgi:transcription elongation factor Elf1